MTTTQLTATGRAPSQPAWQHLPSVARGRVSFSLMTDFQRHLLAGMTDDTLTVCGQTFTRAALLSIFNGHQFPRDPAVCKALGLHVPDYTSLERRIQASTFLKD